MANTISSAIALARRTLILANLLLTLAVSAALTAYAAHVFADGFGEFLGHNTASFFKHKLPSLLQ
jgi:hypothetical protein